MANTLITPTAVTREALRILHQKLNFVGSINRQYDDRFAKSGAKIGDSLSIRLPNEYVVRTGAALSTQDTTEATETLQVATQKGVDLSFLSSDLTTDLDDFSDRILKPAMSVLGAAIESDALSMYRDVSKEVSDIGAACSIADVLNSSKELTDALASDDRTLLLNTQANVDLVDALKGLFNDPAKLSDNYRKGMVANNFLGYTDVFQNTLMPIHTTGTDDGTGDYLVNGGSESGASITVDTGAGTLVKGDIIVFAGVNSVHPETKADTGILKQFAVAATTGTSATAITITPSLTATGAKQNVTAVPANNAAISCLESDRATAVAASADYGISLGYGKNAFAFATADLIMPKGVDFSAREVMDGISMRVVRQYTIADDKFPCRLDVLYGYKTIREQEAVRIGSN
jgi:hypothetical protein